METRTFVLNSAQTNSAHTDCRSGSRSARTSRSGRCSTRRIPDLWGGLRLGGRTALVGLTAAASTAVLLVGMIATSPNAYAAEPTVGLGTAAAYSVLGGQTVTNTGSSTLSGDLGVSPGTAITGFPPGKVAGATHAADAQASQAQSDLVTAYNDAAGRAKTASMAGDLVGKNLTSGVYKSTSSIALSGTLTLNGQGNPNAVFVFQIASTLITASASNVSVINGAQACNVFWQVGSSATLGTHSNFTGTIMALSSITVTTGTVVHGRALARNAAVTLDDDTFTSAACKTVVPPTTTTTTTGGSTTTTPGGSSTTTPGIGTSGPGPGPGGGTGGVPTGNSGTGSSPTPTPSGKVLAFTGAGPFLAPLAGAGALLILLGGLFLAIGRPRTRSRRLRGGS